MKQIISKGTNNQPISNIFLHRLVFRREAFVTNHLGYNLQGIKRDNQREIFLRNIITFIQVLKNHQIISKPQRIWVILNNLSLSC